MPRVFSISAGIMPAMPPHVFGDQGARLPGGEAPVAYRSSNCKWTTGNVRSREPSNCKEIAAEIATSSQFHDARSLKRELAK